MNLKRLLPLLIVPLLLTACPSGANRTKNGPDLRNLPREIRSGEQGPFHVQGIPSISNAATSISPSRPNC